MKEIENKRLSMRVLPSLELKADEHFYAGYRADKR